MCGICSRVASLPRSIATGILPAPDIEMLPANQENLGVVDLALHGCNCEGREASLTQAQVFEHGLG
jgi:hypothetical protein